MSNTKHTPGPWAYIRAYEDGSGAIRSADNRTAIATIPATSKTPREAKEANARLIAAAPELLEALEGVLDLLDRKCITRLHDEVQLARGVIAKAQGATGQGQKAKP